MNLPRKTVAKLIQFQIGNMGEIYLLYENKQGERHLVQGELEHIETSVVDPLRHSDMKINITNKIILPRNMDNESNAPVEEVKEEEKEETKETE